MDDIIHVNASPTREHAEKKRLTYKDADNYGLFCAYRNDGTQSWVVLPNHVLELIHEPQSIDKPTSKCEWQGLTDEEREDLMDNYDVASTDYAQAIEAKLKEKNT